MRVPFPRLAALILTSVSLVNGLLLGLLHHHRGPLSPAEAGCGPVHQHAARGCGGHHPLQHTSQPAGDPADQPEDCPICHYLAQQPVVPEVSGGVQLPWPRDWMRGGSYSQPDPVRLAAYEGRGPPV